MDTDKYIRIGLQVLGSVSIGAVGGGVVASVLGWLISLVAPSGGGVAALVPEWIIVSISALLVSLVAGIGVAGWAADELFDLD